MFWSEDTKHKELRPRSKLGKSARNKRNATSDDNPFTIDRERYEKFQSKERPSKNFRSSSANTVKQRSSLTTRLLQPVR